MGCAIQHHALLGEQTGIHAGLQPQVFDQVAEPVRRDQRPQLQGRIRATGHVEQQRQQKTGLAGDLQRLLDKAWLGAVLQALQGFVQGLVVYGLAGDIDDKQLALDPREEVARHRVITHGRAQDGEDGLAVVFAQLPARQLLAADPHALIALFQQGAAVAFEGAGQRGHAALVLLDAALVVAQDAPATEADTKQHGQADAGKQAAADALLQALLTLGDCSDEHGLHRQRT